MLGHPGYMRFALAMLMAWSLGLSACSPAIPVPPAPAEPIVWPTPPELPRIAYVQSIHRPEDLGISRNFLQKLGDWIFGDSQERELVRPMAVLETPEGLLYIADAGAKVVHRLNMRKKSHSIIYGKAKERFISPVALALGPNGHVYVSDSTLGRIFRIAPDADNAEEVEFAKKLEQPTGITWDAAGERLYVVETLGHEVTVFDSVGKLRRTIGRRGIGDGEFNFPTMIWRDWNGNIVVTDSLNFRIQIFDPNGNFLSKFGQLGNASGYHSRPKGVATDKLGHIYVVDALFHNIQIFNKRGEYLLSVGHQGREFGEFWLPSGIFVDSFDRIYVADSYNRRVQVLRYVGGKS